MNKGLICLLLFCLCACRENRVCVIDGTLPDSRYDGEQVYIVPLKHARADRVDSAVIRNGAFRMEREVEEAALYILRTRPLLRLSLQELLIVAEPGKLAVRIDSVSTGGGTPLNNILEQWKEQKTKNDRAFIFLRRMLQAEGDSTVVLQRIDQLNEEMSAYNYQVVKNNRENVVGAFIYGMAAHSFTPEQKQALDMPE